MTARLLETPVSFDQFIEWLPEASEQRYELHRGVIIEMPKPRGKHSQIAGYTALKVGIEIERTKLPYFIPKECIVRAASQIPQGSLDKESGYEPDVIVLDAPALINEPQWESGSILTLGKSIKVIVEVISINWRDDYFTKLGEYEALGISELWLVDYAALGGRRYIGSPKQPTFTVGCLVDGEYELQQFRSGDRILSPTFPELNLTVDQVFAAGS